MGNKLRRQWTGIDTQLNGTAVPLMLPPILVTTRPTSVAAAVRLWEARAGIPPLTTGVPKEPFTLQVFSPHHAFPFCAFSSDREWNRHTLPPGATTFGLGLPHPANEAGHSATRQPNVRSWPGILQG